MGVAPWTGLISKERVHGHDSTLSLPSGHDRWKLMIAQIFPNEKKTVEIKQIRAFSECIIQQYFGRGGHRTATQSARRSSPDMSMMGSSSAPKAKKKSKTLPFTAAARIGDEDKPRVKRWRWSELK
jgi:hypothetical protein